MNSNIAVKKEINDQEYCYEFEHTPKLQAVTDIR